MVTSIKPEIMIIYLTYSCSAGPEWSNLISRDPLISSALALSISVFRGDITITYTFIHSFSMQVASELQCILVSSNGGESLYGAGWMIGFVIEEIMFWNNMFESLGFVSHSLISSAPLCWGGLTQCKICYSNSSALFARVSRSSRLDTRPLSSGR